MAPAAVQRNIRSRKTCFCATILQAASMTGPECHLFRQENQLLPANLPFAAVYPLFFIWSRPKQVKPSSLVAQLSPAIRPRWNRHPLNWKISSYNVNIFTETNHPFMGGNFTIGLAFPALTTLASGASARD